MIERTDGSPGRAGDLMLPDDAGIVGRPGDVQMQPGPFGREFFFRNSPAVIAPQPSLLVLRTSA